MNPEVQLMPSLAWRLQEDLSTTVEASLGLDRLFPTFLWSEDRKRPVRNRVSTRFLVHRRAAGGSRRSLFLFRDLRNERFRREHQGRD
jgi:hypothetical protein